MDGELFTITGDRSMEFNNPQAGNYLMELYRATGADLDLVVSMYEVGAALSLEKETAAVLAEELIIEGWVELKNLSGGIAITAEGLQALDIKSAEPAAAVKRLSDDPILGEQERTVVESVLGDIRDELAKEVQNYALIEEIVIDIKTLQAQLLSPRAKTAIIRETLRSISSSLCRNRSSETGAKIDDMIRQP